MHPPDAYELSSSDLDHVGHGYPRPQLRRSHWVSLNGQWDFRLDPPATLDLSEVHVGPQHHRAVLARNRRGAACHDTSFYKACWYRRRVPVPRLENGERLLLHFGAVDYSATVWIDRALAGTHVGGYTPFTSMSPPSSKGGPHARSSFAPRTIPGTWRKPRGKQDWQLEPHSIWYPRTTGIWQTVWLERVPATWIGAVRWTSSLERWDIGLEAQIAGALAGRSSARRQAAPRRQSDQRRHLRR